MEARSGTTCPLVSTPPAGRMSSVLIDWLFDWLIDWVAGQGKSFGSPIPGWLTWLVKEVRQVFPVPLGTGSGSVASSPNSSAEYPPFSVPEKGTKGLPFWGVQSFYGSFKFKCSCSLTWTVVIWRNLIWSWQEFSCLCQPQAVKN